MLALLLKAVIFYFAFVFVKSIINGYKQAKIIEKHMKAQTRQNHKNNANSDAIEAEYTVVSDD